MARSCVPSSLPIHGQICPQRAVALNPYVVFLCARPFLPLLTISSEMRHHLSDLERGRLANPHLSVGLGIGEVGVVDRVCETDFQLKIVRF